MNTHLYKLSSSSSDFFIYYYYFNYLFYLYLRGPLTALQRVMLQHFDLFNFMIRTLSIALMGYVRQRATLLNSFFWGRALHFSLFAYASRGTKTDWEWRFENG